MPDVAVIQKGVKARLAEGLRTYMAKATRLVREKGWGREWDSGGCVLHLEVSEFIEALRGKGSDSPETEAADVLFVLLSMMDAHGVNPHRVVEILDERCNQYPHPDRVEVDP